MSDNPNHLCEPQISEEYEAWAHERIHESIAQNNIWVEKYKINDWPRWDYSLEHATLTFSEDGNLKVVCSIQAVGSAQEDSWEWSWGNANLPDACKTRMSEVKQFGEKKQWGRLASLFLKNEESLGWELASVTVHLLQGIAVYRCPDSQTQAISCISSFSRLNS